MLCSQAFIDLARISRKHWFSQSPASNPLDLTFLKEIGVGDRLDHWRQRLANR
jgi:hypothetical protein